MYLDCSYKITDKDLDSLIVLQMRKLEEGRVPFSFINCTLWDIEQLSNRISEKLKDFDPYTGFEIKREVILDFGLNDELITHQKVTIWLELQLLGSSRNGY